MSEKKHTVLLVEDDIELANLIQSYLHNYEFEVELEHNGAEAVERILNLNPDLVILDLMLPGKDGITICKEVRQHYDKGIVMLTASNESIDHILGLEIGADEYLNKPVEPRILLAHIRALLRRQSQSGSTSNNNTLLAGDIELLSHNRQVKVNGSTLDLSRHEYELMLILMQNMGNIITRDKIFKELKGVDYDGVSRFSDILMSQLRNKLAEHGESHLHIKTVRNKGYIFVESYN